MMSVALTNTWKLERLEDVCSQITDGKHGDCQNEADSGFYFVSCKDVANGKVNYENARQITEADFVDTHRRTKFAPSDILITNSGTIGRMALASDSELTRRTTFQKSVAILKPIPSRVDPAFLYYALQSDTRRLVEYAGGTAQKNLLLRDLRAFEVNIAPLPVQRRIAGILSAYDELIENGQRRMRILETMARALYSEWFIDFRFPGHEKFRRVPSPLGDVPQGWNVQRIGDTFETVLGGTPSRARSDFWEGGTIPWINSGKTNDLRVIEPSQFITELALERSAAKLMRKGTTVLAITGATLGQVSLLEIDTAANQSVVGVSDPSGLHSEWLYLTVSDRIEGIIRHASGGAQQHINKEIVNDVRVVLPPEPVVRVFKRLVAPMFQEVATLLFQAQNLRRTRDLLLPRLLSGQIAITDTAA
jgi:type I restriction enzyme, S subunit